MDDTTISAAKLLLRQYLDDIFNDNPPPAPAPAPARPRWAVGLGSGHCQDVLTYHLMLCGSTYNDTSVPCTSHFQRRYATKLFRAS